MKKTNLTLVRAIVLIAVLFGTAFGLRADDEQKAGPLPWSVSLGGGFQHLGQVDRATKSGTDSYSINGDLSVGYFVSDHFKFEGSLGAQSSGDNSGFNHGNMTYLAAAKYYVWPYKEFSPYLGIQGGAFTTFNPGSTVVEPAAGGMVGFEFYINDKRSTSLFLEYNFLYVRQSLFDEFQNKIKIGITVHFGK